MPFSVGPLSSYITKEIWLLSVLNLSLSSARQNVLYNWPRKHIISNSDCKLKPWTRAITPLITNTLSSPLPLHMRAHPVLEHQALKQAILGHIHSIVSTQQGMSNQHTQINHTTKDGHQAATLQRRALREERQDTTVAYHIVRDQAP